jgi:hypothetical protein
MKNTFLIALITIMTQLTASQAKAWWYMNAQIQVSPHVVQGTVYNPLPYPIYCSGWVFGQIQTGQNLYAWIESWITPGTYQYVYVYANAPHYFLNGNSQIYCRY